MHDAAPHMVLCLTAGLRSGNLWNQRNGDRTVKNPPSLPNGELTTLERLRLVGATEAARMRGCHARTIRNLAKAGHIKFYETSPGRRAFRVEDVLMLPTKP